MSDTVRTINGYLSRKGSLESQIKEIDKTVAKLKAEIVKNPEESSSVTMSGSNYIWIKNQDIIEFALNSRQQNQEELDKIDLKLKAIGSLLGAEQ